MRSKILNASPSPHPRSMLLKYGGRPPFPHSSGVGLVPNDPKLHSCGSSSLETQNNPNSSGNARQKAAIRDGQRRARYFSVIYLYSGRARAAQAEETSHVRRHATMPAPLPKRPLGLSFGTSSPDPKVRDSPAAAPSCCCITGWARSVWGALPSNSLRERADASDRLEWLDLFAR